MSQPPNSQPTLLCLRNADFTHTAHIFSKLPHTAACLEIPKGAALGLDSHLKIPCMPVGAAAQSAMPILPQYSPAGATAWLQPTYPQSQLMLAGTTA